MILFKLTKDLAPAVADVPGFNNCLSDTEVIPRVNTYLSLRICCYDKDPVSNLI